MLLTQEGFFDCNQSTLRLFNIEDKEIFAKCHPSQLSPEFQPDGQDSFSKANLHIFSAFKEGSFHFEWMHKKLNGENFPAEVRIYRT